MKGFLLSCLFFSALAQAQTRVQVTDFNFQYQNPLGEGTAQAFSRSRTMDSEVKVLVEKLGEDFSLKVSGAEEGEFLLKSAPSFMTEAESMVVTGFNLQVKDAIALSLTRGNFISTSDQLNLEGLALNCSRDHSAGEDVEQLLQGCLQEMSFKASRFASKSLTGNLVDDLTSSFLSAVSEDKNIGVDSADLRIQNGRYNLSAQVKADISGRIRSHGNVSYDATTGIMTLRISEVKFSFLTVTGKVFDELRKKESERLQVREPFVYLKIK